MIQLTPSDAGVASAMVNTGRQAGGSVGTWLLNTVAASAAASYLAAHLSPRMAAGRPTAVLTALAQVHSYTTAFWWAAALFAGGSILAWLLFRPGTR